MKISVKQKLAGYWRSDGKAIPIPLSTVKPLGEKITSFIELGQARLHFS